MRPDLEKALREALAAMLRATLDARAVFPACRIARGGPA